MHRPLTALEDSYHQVSTVGGAVMVICALAFLSWLDRVRDNARALSGVTVGRIFLALPGLDRGRREPVDTPGHRRGRPPVRFFPTGGCRRS